MLNPFFVINFAFGRNYPSGDFTTKYSGKGVDSAGNLRKVLHARCYNESMDLKRLERWVTTALYVAGGVGLVILLTKNLAPGGSLLQRLAHYITNYLTELGNISEGLLIVIILLILGGNRIMVSIFTGVDRYREWRGKSARIKAEAEAAGRAAGEAAGRAAERAAIRAKLEEQGLNPDDILPPEAPETDDNPPTHGDGANDPPP